MNKTSFQSNDTIKTKHFWNKSFKMLKAFLVIFLFLGLGEGIAYLIAIPVPGNVLGMLLIFMALRFKLIKLEWVKPASDKLIQYLMLFFVPYGVGLLAYFDFIKSYWIMLSVAAGLGTLITLYVTAVVQQKLEKDD